MGWCAGRTVLAGALFAAQTACSSPAARSHGEAPAPSGFRKVPIGLCEDYPEESRSLEGVREDFELMRSLGVDSLRVSLGWDALEPERDRYDFAFWDSFVELATEYRITLIPYVAYTPAWNSDGGEADFWKTPPREPAEFAQLMGLLAARYRGRIRSWELWNEPDNRDYWLGTAEQYAELLLQGARAIESVDPAIEVVSGGLAGHVEFLEEVFERSGVAEHVDVVNLHSYYETWNPEPLETLPEYVEQVNAIVRRNGGRQALWMAELGYGNYRDGARVSTYTSASFAHEHTLEYQAVALVRSMALLLAASSISRVAWYELKDPPGSDAVIGDANNRHLGVAFADHRPKPAARALAFMLREFGAGVRTLKLGVHAESSSESGAGEAAREAEVHAFETPRRTWLVIGWLPTPRRPAGSKPEDTATGGASPHAAPGAGEALDQRRARLRVQLPARPSGPPRHYDAQGRERAVSGRSAPSDGTAAHAPVTGDSPSSDSLWLDLRGDDVEIVEVPF
jgi:hypothetical protein